jgi:hypothetical protein
MRNINPFGLLIVAVGVAASYCISIYQGLQMSPVMWIACIYALIGAAAVTWEMIGWHRAAHLLRERRGLAFIMNIAGLALASCVTVLLFELAFLATALESVASKNAVTVNNRSALEMERANLQASIGKGGAVRGVAAIDADIAGIKTHPRWATTHSCDPDWTTAKDSRALCSRYAAAIAERGLAESSDTAQLRIREISAALTPLGAVGAADARALYISRITGSSEQTARIMVGFLVILFLYFSRAIGGFVFADPRSAEEPIPRGLELRPTPVGEKPLQPPAGNVVAFRPVEHTAPQIAPVPVGRPVGRRETHDEMRRRLEFEALAELEASLNELDEKQRNFVREKIVPVRTAPTVEMDVVEQQIHEFSASCLVPDAGHHEASTVLRNAYVVWCEDNEREILADLRVFGIVMTAIIGAAPYYGAKEKSKRVVYVGVRIKPTTAHRIQQRFGDAQLMVDAGTVLDGRVIERA